jgi:hypothetical protein
VKHAPQGRIDLEEPFVEQDRHVVDDGLNQPKALLHQFDLP